MDERHPHDTPGAGDPDRDLPVRSIVWYGVGLVALATVAFLGMWLTFRLLEARIEAEPSVPARVERPETPLPPEPRLEPRPREPLQRLRATEAERLGTYGWVDAEEGIVRIPVERAMEILATEGLPVRDLAPPEEEDEATATEVEP